MYKQRGITMLNTKSLTTHTVEISKQAFKAIVSNEAMPYLVEGMEHYRKTFFTEKDTNLVMVENFTSFVTQYYIQDINA